MTTRIQHISLAALLATFASFHVTSCSNSTVEAHGATPAAISQADAEPWRLALLDLAFDAASAFPIDPHVKNRSRAQEVVVVALLELDQPQRALECAEGIADWRRGLCVANVAYDLARRGRTAGVHDLLAHAQSVVEAGIPRASDGHVEAPQEWRRDRVRAAIARAYLAIGEPVKAAEIVAGAVNSELGAFRAETAKHVDAAGFDAELAALDTLVATSAFDSLRAALEAYLELFDGFYADVVRRDRVEQEIAVAWSKLPVLARLEVASGLVERALAHGDEVKALALVDSAQLMLEATRGDCEADVPLAARLAGLRSRAGDRERARLDLDTALAEYEVGRVRIADVYRAGVLRPVAEAYAATGDLARSREVFARAVEEGAHNPNSRPRADDLVATAVSMAVAGVEPDAALLARLRQVRAGLGDPW